VGPALRGVATRPVSDGGIRWTHVNSGPHINEDGFAVTMDNVVVPGNAISVESVAAPPILYFYRPVRLPVSAEVYQSVNSVFLLQ